MKMNQHEMLDLCHQVFLLNTPREGAKTDYLIIRFSETPEHVITEIRIVDPAIPAAGSRKEWLRLEQYQQLNVGFAMKAAELLKEMADQLIVFNAQQRSWESREDFAQRVEAAEEKEERPRGTHLH